MLCVCAGGVCVCGIVWVCAGTGLGADGAVPAGDPIVPVASDPDGADTPVAVVWVFTGGRD